MSELKIETMRSSGAGGQHVNTTESAVRITHIPTGITASIQDARSQHQNKDKALKLVAARVRDKQREEEERTTANLKSSLLGSGDRSERIRTYNFPQDRVTDHRCKHTSYGISKLLAGSFEEGLVTTFYPFLQKIVREEQLEAIENE
jgi:peptide chain release factor 1